MIVLLAAALTFGSSPELLHWYAHYHDGVTVDLGESFQTVSFTPRASHRFTLETCNDVGCTTDLYGEICADPLPGDVDCDGAVGAPDWSLLGTHFGQVSP